MRKSALLALTLVSALAGLFLLSRTPQARQIGTNPTGASADQFCVGGRIYSNTTAAATEACLDSSGNWIPTTGGSQNLGSALLPWGTITSGAVGTNDLTKSTYTTTAASLNTTVVGAVVLQPVQIGAMTISLGITISSTIPVIAGYEHVTSSGVGVTIAAVPSISTGTLSGGVFTPFPDGLELVLDSTCTASFYLQDAATLTGSGLHLGSTQRLIGNDKTLSLIFNGKIGAWEELSYANNN